MGLKAASYFSKFIHLKRVFGNKPFILLDIGSGNHSASKAKSVFPACTYHGLDLDKEYNNSPEDFKLMDRFYELDLTKLEMDLIPGNYYDAIIMMHVIEHLFNGDDVVKMLVSKLKPGGYFYIEYPGKKSTRLPSMYGTLNFKDDPTHVRLYSVKELTSVFTKSGCHVLKSGTRRNGFFLFAMPFRIVGHWLRGKKLQANIFWDLLGFAEFLWVRKK
ncbi:MAG: class I SAM-dependent methyltransferase [Chitinophagaceae bacterium]